VVLGLLATWSVRQPFVLSWSDDFKGPAGTATSAATWSYATGGKGWGNNELECYTNSRANSALDGHGDLVITARREPHHLCSDGGYNDYTSARLMTQNKITAKYGTVSVRAKLPSGSGVWPAFWALGDDHDTVGWPRSGEIDIVETVNSTPVLHGTVHGPTTADAAKAYSVTGTMTLPGGFSSAFHTFATEWTPNRISFSLDGHVYRVITRDEVEGSGSWVFDHPFYMLLDLAVGGAFPGAPDATAAWPKSFVIDSVTIQLPR
jgi:beta-glucanase (GH16 family)